VRRIPFRGGLNGEALFEFPGLDELTPTHLLGRLPGTMAGASFQSSSRTLEMPL
jgi:hypothetical protein